MTFPPPQSSPSSPTLSSDSFQPQFEFEAGGGSSLAVPKPLESLHETPVPPFLSKTYDLVDDPALDCIISWGNRGNSFVVWEPLDFARMILPKYFKHNNFSSFVRQLNTYGFRKIDPDKWEFANEGFLRRQKHLLKTIQRRRAHQFQQNGSSSVSSNETALEGEIKALRKERRLMMEEVVELQNQQCGTVQYIDAVNEKLEAAERGQKQMVSFLAKMLESPRFSACISQLREQKSITSPRTKRKFVKHQTSELGASTKGEIVMYQPELCITSEVPYQVEDCEGDELAMVNELLHVPEKGELVLKKETIDLDLLVEQNVDMNPHLLCANENYILSPEGSIPEYSIGETESMVMEEARSVGLEAGGGGMPSSTFEQWGYFSNYNLPDLGIEESLGEDYTDF